MIFFQRFNGVKEDLFGQGIYPTNVQPPFQRGYGRKQGPSTDVKSRVRRSNFVEDQFDILEGVADHLTNTFAINGKHCIQRLICEISEVPVNKLSFMGKILHELIV